MLPKAPQVRRVLVLVCVLAAVPALAQPVGTAFTYQGRLNDGGAPGSGSFDFELRLFDALTAGTQVGPTVSSPAVAVATGLFTVSLDFGPAAFGPNARWLEIAVRPAGGGAYTTLAPRQRLTPTPGALFSSVTPWSGVTGMPAGFADDLDNDVLGALSCANGQVAKWNGSAWACAADADSGGDITAVGAGTGLTGGGTSGAVTLAVDPTLVQSRVGSTCAAGSSIRVVNLDGTVACQPDTTGADWTLTGNAGTNPATNFIGTTDSAPLELRVSNQRALRLERVTTTVGTNTYVGQNAVAGDAGNSVTTGVALATIGGGGGTLNGSPKPNRVLDVGGTVAGGWANQAGNGVGNLDDRGFATVGGGGNNTASGLSATVAGGQDNTASGLSATVAGGQFNTASGVYAMVAGGQSNTASGAHAAVAGSGNTASGNFAAVAGGSQNVAGALYAAVGGGTVNTASGNFAAVPGGQANTAGGAYSLAAGQRAKVRTAAQSGDADGDQGTFVWADDSALADFQSTGPNQFLVRAAGGVGVNTNTPTGELQLGAPADSSAFRFGSSTARQHLISNREMVFNGFTTAVAGTPLFVWRRNTTKFDESSFVELMTLSDNGNLNITGTLSKGGGSFKIDHPLDPENKYLYHSFVESPDMMNIYNGNVTTDGEGYATVALPEWFEALNRDFRYQLTVIGDGKWARARVFRRVEDNRFTIQTDEPAVEVSWQVTGIRKDALAESRRIPVEQDKPEAERGRCLYAEACGREE